MSGNELFQGDFDFKSNDSLDTQISASIEKGDFYLSVISLLLLVLWSIYLLFYQSRVLGLVVSLLLRRFIKDGYIRFGSISLSILGGNLMLRDFAYMTNDYTVRCCYVVVAFNYWVRFTPDLKEFKHRPSNRCLYVYFYGLDVHMYNRSVVYDRLQKLFTKNVLSKRSSLERSFADVSFSKSATRRGLKKRLASMKIQQENDSPESDHSPQSASFMDIFWSHACRLVPTVKLNLELVKLSFGNHLLPRTCMLTCTNFYGTYTREQATFKCDKYQHKLAANFVNMVGCFHPVTDYAGQYAVEEPPKKWDNAFRVFEFGQGKFTYIQDEPGLVPTQNSTHSIPGENPTVGQTWPRQDLSILVSKHCRLYYSPWTDRQRDILWRFFFPSSYEPAQISVPPSEGQLRVARKFTWELKTSTNMSLDLFFIQRGVTKSIQLNALSDSTIKLSIPWLINHDGFRTTLRISLVQADVRLDYLWSQLLRAKQLDLDLHMYYPRAWNAPQRWDLTIKAKTPRVYMLFDYKRFFKSLIEDWIKGTQPDLLQFVPCTYQFHISAENLNFILPANDYNWISTKGENGNLRLESYHSFSAYVAFTGKRFSLTFDLPFVDYLPDVIPLVYAIECVSAKLRLALPETSTTLHVIRELHSRLKLVDRSGRIRPNPFRMHEESFYYDEENNSATRQCWIECGCAPRVTLRIVYAYHPSPWASENWRFLPPHLRPELPIPKSRSKSGRKKKSQWQQTRSQSNSDSSSQSELEELVLHGLRPEGSQIQGPTEVYLLEKKFDADLLAPDTVDVHLHIPNAQLVFYGSLLRHFVHLKENYFGYYQTPVDLDSNPLSAEQYVREFYPHASNVGANTGESGGSTASLPTSRRVLDPRDYRPLLVRVSLEFHNIQLHLPVHSSLSNAPCPMAFLDCIGFEMDKRWHETKLQLFFSPILLTVSDNCESLRSTGDAALSSGRLQLMGLCLRGQGMFSHDSLPINAECLEYAWLLELCVGHLSGQLTAPQLTLIVHAVSCFLFTTIDAENELVCSKDFELCQHAYPQSICPLRPIGASCVGELDLKYRLFRLFLDGVDVGFVESGCCLSLQLDPVRLANCNIHGLGHCGGLFVLIPRVRLIQYIRPVDEDKPDVGTIIPPSQSETLWLEAGSLSLGPVHVRAVQPSDKSEIQACRRNFLLQHDKKTKRLWFLWSEGQSSAATSDCAFPYLILSPDCGCFGQCSFFGCNRNGKELLKELSTGCFQPRCVLPLQSVYKYASDPSTSTESSTVAQYSTSLDNMPDSSLPATHLAESLLVKGRLLHELHNPEFCRERHNGHFLLREEVIKAYHALATSGALVSIQCDSDYSDYEDERSGFSVVKASDVSSASSVQLDGTPSPIDRTEPTERQYDVGHTPATLPATPGFDSSASSMSELLASFDSPNEDDSAKRLPTNAPPGSGRRVNTGRSLASHLPSNLSLNSLIDPLSFSSASSPNHSQTQLPSTPFPTEDSAKHRSPPIPPPRQFLNMASRSVDALDTPTAVGDESGGTAESRSNDDELFNRIVDVRHQLNRPITKSNLLRPAYSRHLSTFLCSAGWAQPLSTRRRWHLCEHIIPDLKELKVPPDAAMPEELPRFGIGLAPRFELVQAGFSPHLLLANGDGASTQSAQDSTTAPGTDMKTPGQQVYSCANMNIWLPTSLDLLLSPLFIEALQRYVVVLAPLVSSSSPSVVIDSMHSNCVNLKTKSIVLPKKGAFPDPRYSVAVVEPIPDELPSTKKPTNTSFFGSNSVSNTVDAEGSKAPTWDQQILSGQMASLNLERINMCFLQLYAVEDLVHLDTLRSGLHDLTCVSLLALCVDKVSFELLNCRKAEHLTSTSREIETPTSTAENQPVRTTEQSATTPTADPLASYAVVNEKSPSALNLTEPFDLMDKTADRPEEVNRTTLQPFPDSPSVGSEQVCRLNINRIHAQLRRLTRYSQFSSNTLLTAVPFECSKTFFHAEADKEIRASITPQSPVWNRPCTGWIMFECGLERLGLSFDRRLGFNHFSELAQEPDLTTESTVKPADAKKMSRAESSKLRSYKSTSFKKKKVIISVNPEKHKDGHKTSEDIEEEEDTMNKVDGSDTPVSKSSSLSHRDGMRCQLRVDKVWLNFPTPKRLPNKRRIELIRSDWNLLSTAAPSIKAWMNPCEKFAADCRRFRDQAERRFLAVTTCLMTEAVNYLSPSKLTLFVLDCYKHKFISHTCACRTGYVGDGFTCKPSCSVHDCQQFSRCVENMLDNTVRCECIAGTVRSGDRCHLDIFKTIQHEKDLPQFLIHYDHCLSRETQNALREMNPARYFYLFVPDENIKTCQDMTSHIVVNFNRLRHSELEAATEESPIRLVTENQTVIELYQQNGTWFIDGHRAQRNPTKFVNGEMYMLSAPLKRLPYVPSRSGYYIALIICVLLLLASVCGLMCWILMNKNKLHSAGVTLRSHLFSYRRPWRRPGESVLVEYADGEEDDI